MSLQEKLSNLNSAEEFVINQIPQIIEQALKDVEEESSYAYQWEE